MMYHLAKDRMQTSKLFKIIRRMPKGALLHCHLEPMLDLEWAIEEVLNTEGMHIKADKGLATEDDRSLGSFTFHYSKKSAQEDPASIWTSSYKSDTLLPIAAVAEKYPDGGRPGFARWVKSRAMISTDESLQHHYGVDDVWQRFYRTFAVIRSILVYEPIFRKFVYNMCKQLLEDGVFWVEMRYVFVPPYYREGNDSPEFGFEGRFRAITEEIERFKASEEGQEFWGARMIWTSLRRLDTKSLIQGETQSFLMANLTIIISNVPSTDMKQCVEMKKLFPDFIAGYDLVGQEDLGRPLQDLVREIFWFKKACAEAGFDIPFFFHAGECLGDGNETDENLFDAVLLGTRRIGFVYPPTSCMFSSRRANSHFRHGFSLYKHPLLIDMVKDKRILIESCPISNEVLRLTTSVLSHPLPALLSRGVPAALCNDDPANLGHIGIGLSEDFTQALIGWDNLGLAGLGSLAENSVRWANYEDVTQQEWLHDIKLGAAGKGVKAEHLQEWIARWEKFCAWVVDEFGADENMDPEE